MWDLPGSGMEPVSPALADGFFTTESPGKPYDWFFIFAEVISFAWSQLFVPAFFFFFFLAEDWVQSLGWENPLEKEMANHSSVLAWKVPWTEEPGGLQSLWSHRVGHNWATNYWNLFFVSTWRPIGGYSLPFSQSSIKRTQRGSEIHTLVLEFIQGILHFLSLSLFFW